MAQSSQPVSNTYQPTTSVTNNTPGAQLGKDDFLKMLVAQMQNQDPSNPTDDTQMAAQLAQFSSLEQMTNVAQSMDALSATMTLGQSFTLIGHEIAYTGQDGKLTSGVVDGVSVTDGAPTLDVDGVSVDPSAVAAVGGLVSQTGTGGTSDPSASQQTPTA
jgi:flagellar basal-body rod modification protein FlgD